jgi:hypothetical protein
MSKRTKPLPRWRVIVIGGPTAREICQLEAKTSDAAIKRVTREYGIEPARQKRLAAHRVA